MINYFFVTDKKQYLVPFEVVMDARKLFGLEKSLIEFDKAYSDRRSKVHKYIKKWALSHENN